MRFTATVGFSATVGFTAIGRNCPTRHELTPNASEVLAFGSRKGFARGLLERLPPVVGGFLGNVRAFIPEAEPSFWRTAPALGFISAICFIVNAPGSIIEIVNTFLDHIGAGVSIDRQS